MQETEEHLEVTIERIVPRGYGLAHAPGQTVFVALAAPGDRVKARVIQRKGAVSFAEITEILEPGPDRIAPRCKYFGKCGGCDFQHLSYPEQLASKVSIIRDCFRRIAKIETNVEIGVIPSPLEFGYRSRAQWHLSSETREIGYYQRNSRQLVPVDECPKLVEPLNAELARLRAELDWERVPPGAAMIDSAAGDGGAVSTNLPQAERPQTIAFTAKGETFRYAADVFFQGNQYLIPALLDAALAGSGGGTSLDLYSGVGLFSIPMSRTFERVIAVEDNPESVRYARRNALENERTNIDNRLKSVRHFLRDFSKADIDFVLLDPPRAGTERDTIENLIKLEVPRISYVACEPSVLARDLRRFIERGYAIDSVTAIDLFPQTHHVETVVRLSKR